MDTCKDGLELDLWNRVFKPRATHTKGYMREQPLFSKSDSTFTQTNRNIHLYMYTCCRYEIKATCACVRLSVHGLRSMSRCGPRSLVPMLFMLDLWHLWPACRCFSCHVGTCWNMKPRVTRPCRRMMEHLESRWRIPQVQHGAARDPKHSCIHRHPHRETVLRHLIIVLRCSK